jgi:hypothetical protein
MVGERRKGLMDMAGRTRPARTRLRIGDDAGLLKYPRGLGLHVR